MVSIETVIISANREHHIIINHRGQLVYIATLWFEQTRPTEINLRVAVVGGRVSSNTHNRFIGCKPERSPQPAGPSRAVGYLTGCWLTYRLAEIETVRKRYDCLNRRTELTGYWVGCVRQRGTNLPERFRFIRGILFAGRVALTRSDVQHGKPYWYKVVLDYLMYSYICFSW